MAEHKMPEPVAWRCSWHKRGQVVWVQYHDETAPLPATWDARPNETLPLYSAETVRELLAEVERLREERDALASADAGAALGLLVRMRFACGDNGKRMQDELEDYLRGLAKDAERYRWLRSCDVYGEDAVMVRGEKGRHTDELLSGDSLDAATDAAMAQSGKGGE